MGIMVYIPYFWVVQDLYHQPYDASGLGIF